MSRHASPRESAWVAGWLACLALAALPAVARSQPEPAPAEDLAQSSPAVAPAAAEPLWELQPSRASLVVAVDPAAHLPPDMARELTAHVERLAENLVGSSWQWTGFHTASPVLRHKLLARFADLKIEDLPPESAKSDKVLVLVLDEQHGGFRIRAREWDAAARLWSAPAERRTSSPAQVADESFRALSDAFSPLALIENVQGSKVSLRLRGGALPVRDASQGWLAKGDVLRPVVRRLDSYGRTERDDVATVPWTYLLVHEAAGAALSAQLHSGIRGPLAAGRRGRTQQLALAVGRPTGPTTLELVAADASARPLEGYDVLVRNPDETTPRWIGRTNPAGQVVVPGGAQPLQIVSIKHGEQLLARLPLAPGLTPHEAAQLVDDDARLEAEGWVAAVQETLVDAVTRRSLLVSQIDARLEAGDNDRARRLLDDLRRLPSRQQLLFEVEQQQQRLTANQPQVARQLERMFGDTKKIVSQHLDPRVIDELELRLSRGRVATSSPAQATNASR